MQERKRDERSKGEYVPVSKVDQLDDAVDHRVTQGDQGVDRAVGDSDGQDLEEKRGVVLEDVLDRQDDAEGSGQEPDQRGELRIAEVAQGGRGPGQGSYQPHSPPKVPQ